VLSGVATNFHPPNHIFYWGNWQFLVHIYSTQRLRHNTK